MALSKPSDSIRRAPKRKRPLVLLFAIETRFLEKSNVYFRKGLLVQAPLGLLRVAGGLRDAHPEIDCRMVVIDEADDATVNRQVQAAMKEHQPSLVGLSALSRNMLMAMKIARSVREYDPAVPVILGGYHATAFPDGLGRHRMFDYYVIGEGARSGPELFNALIEGRSDLSAISGIAYRKESCVVITGPSKLERNLDWMPRLDWRLVDLNHYVEDTRHASIDHSSFIRFNEPTTMFPYLASTGCPFKCTFCERIHHGPFSHFSTERVIDDLRRARDMVSPSRLLICFVDNLIHLDRRWFKQLLERIHRELDCGIHLSARADLLDKEMIDCMAANRVVAIGCFPDSGSLRIRREMKKDFDLKKFMENTGYASQKGLFTIGNFIVGWPGETMQELDETFKLAGDPAFDFVIINALVLLAASEVGRHLDRFDIKPDTIEYFNSLDESPGSLAEYRCDYQEKIAGRKYSLNQEKLQTSTAQEKFKSFGFRFIQLEVNDGGTVNVA